MARLRFKNQYNYVHDESSESKASPESQTVPDQSLSIQDILYRFTVGLPLDNVSRYENYDEEFSGNPFDDDSTFDVHPANGGVSDLIDIVEGQQLIDNVSAKLSRVKNATTINDDAKIPETDITDHEK